MAKRDKERVYCENLRRAGKSYKEIQNACKERFDYTPSKGVCSHWLSGIELSKEQRQSMAKRCNLHYGTHKGSQANKNKKQKRIAKTKASVDYKFNNNELKTAGLVLYWGEGTKCGDSVVAISNSDPYTHRLFLAWLEQCYGMDRKNASIQLQIHENLDIEEAIYFWCNQLNVSKNQFIKPYVKPKCNTNHRKNKLYMGTIQVRFYDTQLWYKIMFEMEGIKKHFSGNSE